MIRDSSDPRLAVRKTVLHSRHVALGAKMVEFGGWEMPLHYPKGILQEHLDTRRRAGLFDVSHMGRLAFHGRGAIGFLQHVLTNNAAALKVGQSQYTMIPNERGGAIDDAYLYRFVPDEYLLVVNAANRQKDWEHFQEIGKSWRGLEMADCTDDLAMISLQGPRSESTLSNALDQSSLPRLRRNELCEGTIQDVRVLIGRTGYTGEPLCLELMVPAEAAADVWDMLVAAGAHPVGLGARDTLRLEAALPLYGHELGIDAEGKGIPIFACPLARFAVSLAPEKGDFIGRSALERQAAARKSFKTGDYSHLADLPRTVMPLAITGKGVARAGMKVYRGEDQAGYVTSGTMVPYWAFEGRNLDLPADDVRRRTGLSDLCPAEVHAPRAIALALVDSRLKVGDQVAVEVRGNRLDAIIVEQFLDSSTPPYARPIILDQDLPESPR